MELLCEEPTRSRQAELVLDYVRTTAGIERRKPADEAPELAQQSAAYAAGAIIARSCIALDSGSQEIGYLGLLHAKKVLAGHTEGIHADSGSVIVDAALDVTINSFGLQESQNDHMTTLARRNLRLQTAGLLNERLFDFNSPQGEEEANLTVGSIVELTALGILSRDPAVLAMPALPHHDIGRVLRSTGANTNVDLTASWHPQENIVRTRQIQTKAGCLSVGKHSVDVKNVPENKRENMVARMRKALLYERSGFLLISGCCDLGLSFTSKNLQTAEYLIKETFGQATDSEIQQLDNATDRLKRLLSSGNRIDSGIIGQLIDLQRADILARRYKRGVTTFLCNLGLGSKRGAISFGETSEVPVASVYL